MPPGIGFRTALDRAWSDTRKLFGWRPVQVFLAVLVFVLTLALFARWRSKESVTDQVVWATASVGVLAVLCALLFLFNLIASPWRIRGVRLDEATAQLAATQSREAYFRRELEAALDREARPEATRKLQNVPTGYKLANAEWLAQNPGIQKEVERLRAENEKLRKLIGGTPDARANG